MLMIDFESARRLVLESVEGRMPSERVVLERAVGRVLAEDIRSTVFLPSDDYSAMDGYAVHTDDFDEGGQGRLPVVGECQTGHPGPDLKRGSCLRIFTGAKLPKGANAVVMQEEVAREGDEAVFERLPSKGAHIRLRGEDLKEGDLVLSKGCRIGAFHLSLLASVELGEVLVSRRPEVSILCTGDELRPPGGAAHLGSLAESNSASLAALIERAGGNAHRGPIVRDNKESLRNALLEQARSSDVIVTVGGVSVGDYDLVKPTLLELGAEIIFHKVSIKPGKPILLAKWKGRYVLGLPGNPSSAQVTFALFGIPLLRVLSGDTAPLALERQVPLLEGLSKRRGRRCFYRAHLQQEGVRILTNQSSGASTTIAWANALVSIDEEAEEVKKGELVTVLAFNDL